MTKDILVKRAVVAIANNLSEIQNYLRITHDMVIDQLCNVDLNDPKSVGKAHERIDFLMSGMATKVEEIDLLHSRLVSTQHHDEEIQF